MAEFSIYKDEFKGYGITEIFRFSKQFTYICRLTDVWKNGWIDLL